MNEWHRYHKFFEPAASRRCANELLKAPKNWSSRKKSQRFVNLPAKLNPLSIRSLLMQVKLGGGMVYPYVERFKQRMHEGPSFVSLVGTGPNGTSQLPVLHALGDEVLSRVKRVDIISASCVSYFLYMAAPMGQIQPEGYAAYERQIRLAHQGSLWRFLRHCLTGGAARAYFDFPLLKVAFGMIFKPEFLSRSLASFAQNLTFYAYSVKRQCHVEISAASHPQMTVLEVCCACTAVPLLHGSFHYQGDELVDCSFAEGFKRLRQQWFTEAGNHLVVNIKKEGENQKAIYVKNSPHRWPMLMVFWDFLSLCLGIPNRNIHRTHQQNLQLLLPQWPRLHGHFAHRPRPHPKNAGSALSAEGHILR